MQTPPPLHFHWNSGKGVCPVFTPLGSLSEEVEDTDESYNSENASSDDKPSFHFGTTPFD